MTTFVDTSALYALLDEDDANHQASVDWFSGPGSDSSELLITHSYVVVESAALVQRRLGRDATRVLFDAFIPALNVFYVDDGLHHPAAAAYLAGLGQEVSFVDRVSFEFIRQHQADQAFVFDRDFSKEGFATVPS